MPRLEPLDPPYSDEVAASFERLMPPGIAPLQLFRTVGNNPRVLTRMQRGGLLDPGSISVRARELAILRTTARCGAGYEFGVHAAFFGATAELDRAAIEAVASAPSDDARWAPEDRAVLALADALHDTCDLDDEQYASFVEHFSAAQQVELVVLCGQYHAVSYACRAFRLDPEPGTEAWAALVER